MIDTRLLSHPLVGSVRVVPVEPERTYALRQRVLRPHQGVEEMALPGADHRDAVAIAALTDEDEVISTAAVTPEAAPPEIDVDLPGGRRWRLRSMATRPDLRSGGLGAAVLAAVVAHVAEHGGGVLWCNARLPAVAFYERAGFATIGESWITDKIGPHIVMWRTVPTEEADDE